MITEKNPAPGATSVDPWTRPTFTSPDQDIVVWVNGSQTPFEARDNGVGGYDIVVKPASRFDDLEYVTLRVDDDTWSFQTADRKAPELLSADPGPWAIVDVSPPQIEIRLTNDLDTQTLNVTVAGIEIVVNGAAQAWSATIVDGLVTMTPDVVLESWVPVSVRVSDAAGNRAEIDYGFEVGDARGPIVYPIDPRDDARGLAPTSHLIFDVRPMTGLLNVIVDNDAAIVDGVPVGDFDTSQIVGERVTLIKTTPYANGDIVHVQVTCGDGERRVLRYQFGVTEGNRLLPASHFRAQAFDLTSTPFANPVAAKYTGFAWDGNWYEQGDLTDVKASWTPPFPLSGVVTVTESGWQIYPVLATGAWMTCQTPVSGWNMAGSGVVRDVAFGPGSPILSVVADNLVTVDFGRDCAYLFSPQGRTLGANDIAHRQDPQTPVSLDPRYSIPQGPYTHVAALDTGVWILGRAETLVLILELSAARQSGLMARDHRSVPPPRVKVRPRPGIAWVRFTVGEQGMYTPIAMAYNDQGQGNVEIWDWFALAYDDGAPIWHLDDAEGLPTSDVRDISPLWPEVGILMADEVNVVDPTTHGIVAYSRAEIGAESDLVGLAMDGDVIYVASARVTRFRRRGRTYSILSTDAPTCVVALGHVDYEADGYVGTRMEIR